MNKNTINYFGQSEQKQKANSKYRQNDLTRQDLKQYHPRSDDNFNDSFHYSIKIERRNCIMNHLMVIVSRCLNDLDIFEGVFKYKISESIQISIIYNIELDDDIDITIKKQISQHVSNIAQRYFSIIQQAINGYQLRVQIDQFQKSLRKILNRNRYNLLMQQQHQTYSNSKS